MKKQAKGITLIALVITIIILLILAGITINLTVGQRGILTRAQEAGRNYQEAAKREDEELENFLKEADDIINGITPNGGTTPQEPEISEEVKGLKAGDYIKYDTGVSTVGENGVVMFMVLYPVDSEYGLQIISDKNVREVSLGGSNLNWEEGKASYNESIKTLNREAEKYVNTVYACDGRCVGSIPTVTNGIFVDKSKGTETTLILPPSGGVGWSDYRRPMNWSSDDTGCYNTDMHYGTDETALKRASMWKTGEAYWLASRNASKYSSARVNFSVMFVTTSGSLTCTSICDVDSLGNTAGCKTPSVFGIRPCISLKSNIIKITGGDGKSADTAYTIGK